MNEEKKFNPHAKFSLYLNLPFIMMASSQCKIIGQ